MLFSDEINRTSKPRLPFRSRAGETSAGMQAHFTQTLFTSFYQNPISNKKELHPLPEAQLDRFMFNVLLTYPTFQEELTIVKTLPAITRYPQKLINAEQIQYFQQLIRTIPVTDNVLEYAVKLTGKTVLETHW
ncbi:hypothetical protein CS542_06080 [Pedobacter sp. IW39]|nr:hypothetical protein CS542_06080 [Pedobacter sp. IW39]